MKYFSKLLFNNFNELRRQFYIERRLVSFEKCFKNNSFWINQKMCTFSIIHNFSQFEKTTNFQKFKGKLSRNIWFLTLQMFYKLEIFKCFESNRRCRIFQMFWNLFWNHTNVFKFQIFLNLLNLMKPYKFFGTLKMF
jgi:hypothetical protein